MRREEIIALVDSMIRILSGYGQADHVDWLGARRRVLSDPTASNDALEATIEELHSIVLGMGGLMDLSLEGPSADGDRKELDELANRLYELTR
jgi:hypothetical protein